MGGVTHGYFRGGVEHPLYRIWYSAKDRCHNPKHPNYHQYGARGIVVCERWRYDFATFLADVSPRPAGHQLDRRDNDGPYSPENVRWVLPVDNNRNKRNTRRFTCAGMSLTVQEWSDLTGISHDTLYTRMGRLAWNVLDALTLPKQNGRWVR